MKYELRENGLEDLGLIDPLFEAFMFGGSNNMLSTDIEEDENNYNVVVSVPGIKKDEIKLSVDDGYLNISYEHKRVENDGKRHFLRKERFYESTSRSFYLGDVDSQGIKANLDSGVLTIVVPKIKVESKAQYIEIQ